MKVQFVYLPLILTAGKTVEVASFAARFLWELDMPSRSPLDTLDFPLPLVAFLSLFVQLFFSLSLSPFFSSNFEGFFLLRQKPLTHSGYLWYEAKPGMSMRSHTSYYIHAFPLSLFPPHNGSKWAAELSTLSLCLSPHLPLSSRYTHMSARVNSARPPDASGIQYYSLLMMRPPWCETETVFAPLTKSAF